MSLLVIIILVVAAVCIVLGTALPALWYSVRGGGEAIPPPKAAIWRRAAWDFHITVLGLFATATATIFMTESLKVLMGKPRPDCLARCQPDLSSVSNFVVGGLANPSGTGQLVSKAICTGTDSFIVNDGFKSFPSGHASTAAATLGYISLFLAGKFGVLSLATLWTNKSTPKAFYATVLPSSPSSYQLAGSDSSYDNVQDHSTNQNMLGHNLASASAPRLCLVLIAWVPYAVAIFVAGSRWHDYRHHPFDVLFGFFFGSLFAALGYRFTQLHLARADGVVTPSKPLEKVEKV